MKKIAWIVWLPLLALLLLAKTAPVKVMKAKVFSAPDYLSKSLAELHKGERVDILELKGAWALVKTGGGVKGYIHGSVLETGGASLTTLLPGQKGVTDKEVALAAKGFSEETERRMRGQSGFNFVDLDWILPWEVAPADLAAFIKEGKLK